MPDVTLIYHKSVQLYYTNLEHANPDEVEEVCQRSQKFIAQFPEKSVLSLINIKGIRFNARVIQIIKETTKKNRPYVSRTALVGLDGLTRILIQTVSQFSQREIKVFDSHYEAQEWLIERAEVVA